MEQSESFYNATLSYIHDTYFGKLAFNAAQEIKSLLFNRDPSTQLVVDLGCGSGLLAHELTKQGFNVLGVDLSGPMLEIAKRKAPKATFIQASLFNFPIPICDIVCAIGEPVNYIFGNKSDNTTVNTLIQHIYNQLKPQCYFLFDMLTIEAEKTSVTKVMDAEKVTMIVQTSVDEKTSVLTRNMTFFTKEGNFFVKQKETHQQQLFDKVRIIDLLKEAGFKVTVTSNYNSYPFREGHFAFLCQK